MKLLAKFNMILFLVFMCGLIAVSLISHRLLQDNAQSQVMQNARIMMETATAMRNYTTVQIKPLLSKQMQHTFLPQSVPAFAATESFNELRKKYPQYTYKEATLNPTNLRDRTTDWESDLVNQFRNDSKMAEKTGIRDTPFGQSLFLCRPIRITDKACLSCHSTPAQAPPSMLARYGKDNGFGWEMGDVIGAQIVSVPTSLPEQVARRDFGTLLGSLIIIFFLTMLVLNLMLTLLVIRPVAHLAQRADDISKGIVETGDLPVNGKDEIAGLTTAFNRMMRSLKKAMAMLEEV